MKAVQFDVSVELLADVLHMPPGSRIIGTAFSHTNAAVTLIVDVPDVPEADQPHKADPQITKEQYRWDWNIQ